MMVCFMPYSKSRLHKKFLRPPHWVLINVTLYCGNLTVPIA